MKTLKVLLCGLLLAVPVFANETDDRKTATSLKYVTHELDTRQNKLDTGDNKAITYTNAAGGVVQRTVKSDLAGGSTSDTSLPTVGAVTDGLSHKQNEIEPINDHTAVTYTGQTGEISTKGIYQVTGTYADQSDNLIDAKTFNAALKNGLDNEFVCDEDNLSPGGDCWLWQIHNTGTNSTLPPGYTQLEYIQGDKNAYINTQITLTNNSSAEAKFQFPNIEAATSGNFIMGSRVSSNNRGFTLVGFSGGNRWASGYGSNGGTFGTPDTNIHVMQRDKDKVYLDGVLVLTTPVSAFITPGPAYIFSVNQNGTPYLTSNIKLWYLKIWDNGILARNFIPAIQNSDNKVGMYDTVSGMFFSNAGSGTFTAGEPINNIIYVPQGQ